jgi:trehalose 6-phosphate synthase
MPHSDLPPRGRAGPPSRPLAVVSNREPFLHSLADDGTISWSPPTSGVAVALDALMRERGGVWVAHGAGTADRLVVDGDDRILVPPDAPNYALRRIWLTELEEHRYYEGFANEGLWPLCHVAHVKPVFRAEDWRAYQAVNERFAIAVDAELPDRAAPVFIQDYQLALVAPYLRALRPDARIALFWHIPFPHPDKLRICPYRREILQGLLAADLLAFQLERDRRNFLAAARFELDAKVSRSRVHARHHTTTVCAVPVGVDFDRIQTVTGDPTLGTEIARLRRELRIETPLVGIGVDRLDYTKGIPERLDALDCLFTRRPELRTQLTFVQIAVPSRSKLESYAAVEADIDRRVAAFNARHAGEGVAGGPIRYRKSALRIRRLVALYRLADFCIVSSLHDGMNLVAKEFVAAREDLGGVLVLSELAGAAQELGDAVIINPYDVEGFADGLETALDMALDERHRRMRVLRRVVAGRDVLRWASDVLEGLEHLDPRSGPPASTGAPRRPRGGTGVSSPPSIDDGPS